jgi:hypothetical protein
MKNPIICLTLLLMLVSCNDINTGKVTDFSTLNGNNYLMKVDRISDHPEVSLPSDNLNESNFTEYNEEKTYTVYFSGDGMTVTLDPGQLGGTRKEVLDNTVTYELTEGVFAGGRFIVWPDEDHFKAELTIYGSGVPIIWSERGNLLAE